MTRDNIVFATCGLLLGLLVGGFLIGPHVGTRRAEIAAAAITAPPEPAGAMPAAASGSSPMDEVRQRLADLKSRISRNPQDFEALVQLGSLYMQAAKYDQAEDYFQRALRVRNEPAVALDLGNCYRQQGRGAEGLQIFRDVEKQHPEDLRAAFNEALVLHELQRDAEARTIVARLQQQQPDDPDVKRLAAMLR